MTNRAAGLVHVPELGYVVAVLSGAPKDKEHRDKRIDFYRSHEDRITGAFSLLHSYHVPRSMQFDKYQSLNLLYQASGDVYLVGMTSHIADLFWVPFPGLNTPSPAQPSLEFLARRRFKPDKHFAELKAGAGVHAANGRMRLYAVPQWRLGDGRLHMTEWSA